MPMLDPTLLLLASLVGGEKHGYAMMADIEAFAGVRLGAGTLYGAVAPGGATRLDRASDAGRAPPAVPADTGGTAAPP